MSRARPPEEFLDSHHDDGGDDDPWVTDSVASPEYAERHIRSASFALLGESWRLHAWPRNSRDYMFLGEAVLAVGRAMFGSRWKDSDLFCLRTVCLPEKITTTHEAIYPLLKAGEAEKCRRVRAAFEAISDNARDGSLDTFFRLVKSEECGDFSPARPGFWNVDDVWASRFEKISTLHQVGMPPAKVPVYLFVTAVSLSKLIERLTDTVGSETEQLADFEQKSLQRDAQPAPVRGYAYKDQPLVNEMRRLVLQEGLMPWAAAKRVVKDAAGVSSQDAKLKRLVDRYRRVFPPEN